MEKEDRCRTEDDTVARMATLEGLLKAVENLYDHYMMCEGSWGHVGIREYESMVEAFQYAKCAQGRVKESYVGDHRDEGGAVEDWSNTSSHRHYEEN